MDKLITVMVLKGCIIIFKKQEWRSIPGMWKFDLRVCKGKKKSVVGCTRVYFDEAGRRCTNDSEM